MSKKAKSRNKEKRDAAKKARRSKNYIRYGPKADHSGRRQKRSRLGTFKPGNEESDPITPDKPKGKKKNLKSKGKKKFPKRPFRHSRHMRTKRSADKQE